MTSVPIEILGKALAESIDIPVTRLFGHTNGGKGEERKSLRLYFKAVLWLQDSLVQNYYRMLVRVNNQLRAKGAICAHGFAKDCPTCAHFAKVRASELPDLPTP